MKLETSLFIYTISLFFSPFLQGQDTTSDSIKNIEINKMWKEISRSVKEGDFIGYKSTCHEKGVFISTTGKNKVSVPLSTQLKKWEKNFTNTKEGLTIESVDFRFKQKVSDPTTAHYIGMFYYTLTQNLQLHSLREDKWQ